MKKIVLLSVRENYGFFSLLYGASESHHGTRFVAFSYEKNQSAFKAEVDSIYDYLSYFCPRLEKASWNEKEQLMAEGWDPYLDLKSGKLESYGVGHRLNPFYEGSEQKLGQVPSFPEICNRQSKEVMITPDVENPDNPANKLFDFLKNRYQHHFVLGTPFDKEKNVPAVKNLVKNFGKGWCYDNLYVPGYNDIYSNKKEVLGFRENPKTYLKLCCGINGYIGIPCAITWFMLACFSHHCPMIILYDKDNTLEDWEKISKDYGQYMYDGVYAIGYDKNTNFEILAKEVEDLYDRVFNYK